MSLGGVSLCNTVISNYCKKKCCVIRFFDNNVPKCLTINNIHHHIYVFGVKCLTAGVIYFFPIREKSLCPHFFFLSFAHQHLAIMPKIDLLFLASPLHLSSSVRLDGGRRIFRFLQKYLIGFKLRLWLGHSRTFTALYLNHYCCVLCWVTVLLEGKPSAQSEVLDWVFIKAISIFWCIELFIYSDESLSPSC